MGVPIGAHLVLGNDLGRAKTWLLEDLAPAMTKAGFRVSATTPTSVTWARRFLPGWALVLGIITLPFGLLILAFARSTQTLIFDLQGNGADVVATAAGEGPEGVAELLDRLQREGVRMQGAADTADRR
jgi:hypothetical protein